jgi:hypothetical protein
MSTLLASPANRCCVSSYQDHTDVLAQLNKLMGLLLIPISIPELSVATPSLLLAVLESILERRFLALNGIHQTLIAFMLAEFK